MSDGRTDMDRAVRLLSLKCADGQCGGIVKLRVEEITHGFHLKATCRTCAGYEHVFVTQTEAEEGGLHMKIEAAFAIDERRTPDRALRLVSRQAVVLRAGEKLPDQTEGDDAVFALATAVGCKPVWADGILGWAWHCGCEGNAHGMDQQCSVLTEDALRP